MESESLPLSVEFDGATSLLSTLFHNSKFAKSLPILPLVFLCRRFGFPNKEALDRGLTGTDCRGEEHDVTIVWSVTSGKRQIAMDGKEIHYSSSRSGLLDFSWTTRGNHVIKVIAHAAPPLSATPGFRQYDLLIDGQSFFTMPKVYELGLKGPIQAHARVPGDFNYAQTSSNYPTSPLSAGSGGAGGRQYDLSTGEYIAPPRTREEEEEDLKKAIAASIEESRRHLEGKSGGDDRSAYTLPQAETGADLLDLGGQAASSAAYSQRPAFDTQSVYSAPPTYSSGQPPSLSFQSPPGLTNSVGSPQPAYAGALVPAHAPPGYYGAPPPYASPPAGTPSYASPPPQASSGPPQGPSYTSPPPVPPVPAPTPEYRPYEPAQEYYSVPPGQPRDVFGLASPPEEDPFAPKPPPPPSRDDIAREVRLLRVFLSLFLSLYLTFFFRLQILGAYSAPTTPAGMAPPNQFASPNGEASPQMNGHTPQIEVNGGGRLSMNTLAITAEAEEEEELDPVQAAMRKLVNIDRIDEPAEEKYKLTMMQKEEKDKTPKNKSKALPPVASGYVGANATLEQIKTVKPVSAFFIVPFPLITRNY